MWVRVQDNWWKWVSRDGGLPVGKPPEPPVRWEDGEPDEPDEVWVEPVGMEDV